MKKSVIAFAILPVIRVKMCKLEITSHLVVKKYSPFSKSTKIGAESSYIDM